MIEQLREEVEMTKKHHADERKTFEQQLDEKENENKV